MTIAQWRDELRTGNDVVDGQHQHFFELFNSLHARLEDSGSGGCYDDVISELKDYTLFHFTAEEDLMSVSGLDAAEVIAHLRAHRRLDEMVQEIEAECSLDTAIRLVSLMSEWLTDHIGQFDRRLAEHTRPAT